MKTVQFREARRSSTMLRWTITLAAVAAATAVMYIVRPSLDKAHVTLVYLLIVLVASSAGGRGLGLTVAAVAFLCFNFFFLVPYHTFTIENPLDWMILFAFLITSVVAAQLLYRATTTAEEATQRAIEVDRLAALGAETLNAADADEALQAIAGVIRNSVDADECDIYLHGIDGRVLRVARATASGDDVHDRGNGRSLVSAPRHGSRRETQSGSLVEWILDHGSSAVELTDGTVRVAHEVPPPTEAAVAQHWEAQGETIAAVRAVTHADDAGAFGRVQNLFRGSDATGTPRPNVRALAFPLRVRERTVGVLRLAALDELRLTPEQARLLLALAYYAALGAERARLVATAERAEAERRVESLRSALLTAVSHDLRTPLTTIKGVASEIRHGADIERAAVIEAEAVRMDALVSDLLDLSRIHAGAVQPTIAVNTIDDLLGAALRGAAGMLGTRRVEVDAPRETLLSGFFDFTQTLRIVLNLLDNAAKYSPSGTPIDLRVRQVSDRLLIDVMDRGPGVPERERDRIFDPFYRPLGVPADIRGHGLGLSIARGLAEAQGGSVRFSPRQGGGSVFTLDLPAANTNAIETGAAFSG